VEKFSPFLKSGGILILHDTRRKKTGVNKYFLELKNSDKFEFVNEYISKERRPCGIGVLRCV
jgi:hypothetical protein